MPALIPVCTLGIAFWLAFLMKWTVRKGKIRDPVWMGRVGIGVGLLAWYFQWGASLAMKALGPSDAGGSSSVLMATIYFALRPDLMIAATLGMINRSPSGLTSVFFVLLWVVELLVFVLSPRAIGIARARDPFCEQTQTWAEEIEERFQFNFIADPERTRCALEADPGALDSILGPAIGGSPKQFASLTFYRCRGDESFVTIENFAAMAPEQVPISELRILSEAMPDKVECFAQVDDAVVELLRIPVADPGRLLCEWREAASMLPATSMRLEKSEA